MEKIFLLVSLSSNPLQFNAKADPEKAIELREQFAAIIPGYHMNKKHWNTVIADGSLSNVLLKEIISDSYNLVVKSLPKKRPRCTGASITLIGAAPDIFIDHHQPCEHNERTNKQRFVDIWNRHVSQPVMPCSISMSSFKIIPLTKMINPFISIPE